MLGSVICTLTIIDKSAANFSLLFLFCFLSIKILKLLCFFVHTVLLHKSLFTRSSFFRNGYDVLVKISEFHFYVDLVGVL